MRSLSLVIALISATLSSASPCYTEETPFMQMNHECYIRSDQQFVCQDIHSVLEIDPDSTDDTKMVCSKAKANKFTNDDLATLINSKFREYDLPCSVFPIHNSNHTQLRAQCPKLYTELC